MFGPLESEAETENHPPCHRRMVNEETSDRSWKGKDKEKEIKKRERRKEQREQSGIKHLWEVGATLSASSKSESQYELFQCAKVNGTSQCVHLYKSCLLQGNIVPACFVSLFQPGRMSCLSKQAHGTHNVCARFTMQHT